MLRIALVVVLPVIVTACGSSSSEEQGSGGSAGADGGGAGGADACPPTQSYCPQGNWCGGDTVVDANGCQSFACANGADPCVTEPCAKSKDCAADEVCGGDHLCWPASSFCEPPKCGAASECSGCCTWSCVDGYDYTAFCNMGFPAVTYDCQCSGPYVSYSCELGLVGLDAGACCGLPPFDTDDGVVSTHGKPQAEWNQ
jgi:hypothetical protein